MKIYKNNDAKLPENTGTTFYKVTEDQLLKYYDKDKNPIARYIVSENGFNAFDLDLMYGSEVIGDALYYCDTDGFDIEVNGQEVAPEDALDKFGVDALTTYIKDADTDFIKRHLSSYEFKPVNLDKVAADILDDGSITFTEMVKFAYDLDLIDL